MGQKANPVGLRVGLHRKWSSSWLTTNSSVETFKYSPVISARGGLVRSSREDTLCSFLRRFPDTIQPRPGSAPKMPRAIGGFKFGPNSSTGHPSLAPIDLHIIIGSGRSVFIIFFYNTLKDPT